MTVSSKCPYCGESEVVSENAAAKKLTCGRCGRCFETPVPGSPTPLCCSEADDAAMQPEGPAPGSAAPPTSDESEVASEPVEDSDADEPQMARASRKAAPRESQFGMQAVRRVFEDAEKLACFYRAYTRDLWSQVEPRALPQNYSSRQREIRVSATEEYKNAEWDGERWQVELPPCCVVCGQHTNDDWQDEARTVPNLFWPLWAPACGLGVGLIQSIFWSIWLLPIPVAAGFVLGYVHRNETDVRVRFRRCREHAECKRYPRLRLSGNELVIRVGRRPVKIAFLARENSDSAITTSQLPVRQPVDSVERKPIPLAAEQHRIVPREDKRQGDRNTTKRFWINTDGRVSGPFSSVQLRKLASAGHLQPRHSVSTDREKWVEARAVKGLTFSEAAVADDDTAGEQQTYGFAREPEATVPSPVKRFCPTCGRKLLLKQGYCPTCAKIPVGKKGVRECTTCQSTMPSEFVVCPRCGADLADRRDVHESSNWLQERASHELHLLLTLPESLKELGKATATVGLDESKVGAGCLTVLAAVLLLFGFAYTNVMTRVVLISAAVLFVWLVVVLLRKSKAARKRFQDLAEEFCRDYPEAVDHLFMGDKSRLNDISALREADKRLPGFLRKIVAGTSDYSVLAELIQRSKAWSHPSLTDVVREALERISDRTVLRQIGEAELAHTRPRKFVLEDIASRIDDTELLAKIVFLDLKPEIRIQLLDRLSDQATFRRLAGAEIAKSTPNQRFFDAVCVKIDHELMVEELRDQMAQKEQEMAERARKAEEKRRAEERRRRTNEWESKRRNWGPEEYAAALAEKVTNTHPWEASGLADHREHVREFGEEINDRYGFEGMKEAWHALKRRHGPGPCSDLNRLWHGIGRWEK